MIKKAIFSIVLLFLAVPLFCIRISPGVFTARNVPVGEKTNFGVNLLCYNDSDSEKRFVVEKAFPSKVKKNWLKGYIDIPDTSFFVLDAPETLVAPPGEPARAAMYIDIPDDERFYNQHWAVSLIVKEITGSMFQTAIATLYFIETESKENMSSVPFGELAVLPSIVTIDGGRGEFVLFNNDTTRQRISFTLKEPALQSDRVHIEISSGFKPLPVDCIKVSPKELTIAPGKKRTIKLKLKGELPDTTSSYECFLMIEGEDARNFVRVRVKR
ncbi:hypothetical protein J7K18_08070 [bacterium]|nr:hypothetical protein [bacterium]